MGKLVLFLADGTTLDVPLDRERITIGRRADNDVCLPYPAVCGEHAAVVTILADSFLEDLGSTNGTLVNGKPIVKHFLRDRDQIDIGRQRSSSSPTTTPQLEAPRRRDRSTARRQREAPRRDDRLLPGALRAEAPVGLRCAGAGSDAGCAVDAIARLAGRGPTPRRLRCIVECASRPPRSAAPMGPHRRRRRVERLAVPSPRSKW